MKRFLYKTFLLLTVFGLTACGYSLNELYNGDSFNSINFADNYYRAWDKAIDYKKENNKITNPDVETIALNKSQDYVFTSFSDDNFRLAETNASNYVYYYDYDKNETAEGLLPYGPNNNLIDINSSFKYGFISRLFDGELFCDGNYERARVQLDSDGFGRTFGKELHTASYFAISFKTSIEFRRVVKDSNNKEITIDIAKWWNGASANPNASLAHKCDINLVINFYLKNENGYERVPVSYTISDVDCNYSDSVMKTNYVLFGFEIGHSVASLERCAGISIEYTYNDTYLDNMNANIDSRNETNALAAYDSAFEDYPESRQLLTNGDDNSIGHSILLYEVMFPHSTWH